MLKTPMPTQHELEMVTLEELVPKDHLLRQIDAAVDFEFIRAKVAHLYCADNGRPALDPVVMFKLLFIGYLFGVRSERQLMREVQVNVAYRWFARFRLTDKVPDASTFSQNRRRRFTDTTVYQEIFDEIVRQAIKRGLVDGRVLYTDSTHLKANANKGKFDVVKLEQTPAAYTEALNAAVDADRAAHGRKPLDRDDDGRRLARTPSSAGPIRTAATWCGTTSRKGFFYLDHRTVDAKHAIITDTHVTPASVHDSQPYLDRLDRQRERFEFKVEAVGLDAGYFTPAVCQGLEERGIAGVMGYRTPNHKPGMFYKRQFKYDAYRNEYVCPRGRPCRTARPIGSAIGNTNPMRRLRALPGTIAVHEQCDRGEGGNAPRVERAKERVDARRLTEWGQRIYARRKQTVERSFADAKQLHGHRYARMRGLRKVAEQCLLAAAAQNIKKIAMLLARKRKKGPAGPDWRFVRMLLRLVSGLRCSFDYPLAANPQS
ncbi:IS1182 family transposase [Burkholderia mallei]|uniref:IS1182 family transposase n=1 Tax=Burkholderia mallei TaxID=13373 RepID=UPI001F240D80|nr:IS1182 family transposase [Burkholderia mallei]